MDQTFAVLIVVSSKQRPNQPRDLPGFRRLTETKDPCEIRRTAESMSVFEFARSILPSKPFWNRIEKSVDENEPIDGKKAATSTTKTINHNTNV